MAERDHLMQLTFGRQLWNKWRLNHPSIVPDLSGADLRRYAVGDVFAGDDHDADVDEDGYLINDDSDYYYSPSLDLVGANLGQARFTGMTLNRIDFSSAHLGAADFTGASVLDTRFIQSDLSDVSLAKATLMESLFIDCDMQGVNFANAFFFANVFAKLDLRQVTGLSSITHVMQSSIGIETLYMSGGMLPQEFLKGTGMSRWILSYPPSCEEQEQQYFSCFISYSASDQNFVSRLYRDLTRTSVRCWLATHDLPIGARIRLKIDETIQTYDKLLLVLSERSLSSQWVEQEVETALARERQLQSTILVPIRIDDSIMVATAGWAAYLRNTRHIGDFRQWHDRQHYWGALLRLKRDIEVP